LAYLVIKSNYLYIEYRASSAIEGFGVEEGINWLAEIIKKNK